MSPEEFEAIFATAPRRKEPIGIARQLLIAAILSAFTVFIVLCADPHTAGS